MQINILSKCICCFSKNLRSCPAVLMPFISDRIFNWKPTLIEKNWNLKTIKKGMVYSLVNTLGCNNCGVMFLDIRFNKTQMSKLYDGYRNKEYIDLRNKYEPGYRKKNKLIKKQVIYFRDKEKFLKKNISEKKIKNFKILDYGGNDGLNTPFKKYKKVSIFELNKKINSYNKKKENFDLIVCTHVLEHEPHPTKLINKIKKNFMKKSSYLYLEIPIEKIVYDSHPKKPNILKKKHWHEHINFFTEESLVAMFKKTRLMVIDKVVSHKYANGSFPAFWQILLKKIS